MSLPVPRVVLVARIAMLLVACAVGLLASLPRRTVICMRWMRPAAIAHRQGPFTSLPLPLIRLAVAI